MSLQTNTCTLPLESGKSLKLLDIPGHPRIRGQFAEHLAETRAIVFVVDASTVSRNGSSVAEYVAQYLLISKLRAAHALNRHLHTIFNALTSLPPSHTFPSIAIVAHKADLLKAGASSSSTSLSVNRVKTILERELEKRRASQAGGVGVEGLGEEGESTEMGGLDTTGKPGESFTFDRWDGGEVEFMGTSVKIGSNDDDDEKQEEESLVPLRDWLESLV
jgi:signal recognition particle receptor subunit beta